MLLMAQKVVKPGGSLEFIGALPKLKLHPSGRMDSCDSKTFFRLGLKTLDKGAKKSFSKLF